MSTYYFSNNGSDSNNGLSGLTPFKTLTKLAAVFTAGDTLLFERGSVFYGNIIGISSPDNGKTVFDAYGFGNMPVICGFKNINSDAWVSHATNVWKVDLTDITKYTGLTSSLNTDVGFIKVNGTIQADKKETLAEIDSQWDFYSDAQYVYVFSTTDPGLETLVQVTVDLKLVQLSSNMKIYNIAVQGTGGHAMQGSGTVHDVTISNCDISDIGGSFLGGFGAGTTRYGNGIEFYNGGKNCKVINNKITGCYDAAFTMQGNSVGGSTMYDFENMYVAYNTFDNCTFSLEFWEHGGTRGYKNCIVEHNVSNEAGYSWGYDVRPDKNVGSHIVLYSNVSVFNDLIIRNNTFNKSRDAAYYIAGLLPTFTFENNSFYLRTGQKILYQQSYVVADYLDYVSATGFDVGSVFFDYSATDTTLQDVLKKSLKSNGLSLAKIKSLESITNETGANLEKITEKQTDFLATVSAAVLPNTIPVRGSNSDIPFNDILLSTLTNGFNDAKTTGHTYRNAGSVSIPNEPYLNFNGVVQYFGQANFGIQRAFTSAGVEYVRTYWFGTWRAWKATDTVEDTALSSNIGRNDTAQTVSGTKTFTSLQKFQNGVIALLLGADAALTTLTNAVGKIGRIASPHYTNAEEPVAVTVSVNNSTTNILSIGGGSSALNTVNELDFYTAVGTNTLTGTRQLKIFPSGNLAVQDGGTYTDITPSKWSVNSTSKGALPAPRMTTTERDAIAGHTGVPGLMVYNATTDTYDYYSNGWQSIPKTADLVKHTKLTADGDGVLTTIVIPHGLTGITSSSIINVSAKTADAGGISFVTTSGLSVFIHYTVAPPSGTGNLVYDIIIK